MSLSENISMFPSLQSIHPPGRVLVYADLISRSLNNVKVWNNTKISQEHAELTPMLASLQPGTMIPNEQMLALINHEYD